MSSPANNRQTYNGNTVVVNVGTLVELLLELGVLTLGSKGPISSRTPLPVALDLLDTTRVKVGLVNVWGSHVQCPSECR